MLFCISAPNAPISIDSAEMIARIMLPGLDHAAEGREQHVREHADGGDLRRRREERHDRRRRALINVWRPDVERRSRSLERQTADQEHEAERSRPIEVGAAAIARHSPSRP